MKIIGLRIEPIARVSAIIYATLGFLFWISFCLSSADTITLPVGVIAPLLHLNFNFSFHRSSSVVVNCLFLLGSAHSLRSNRLDDGSVGGDLFQFGGQTERRHWS